MEFICNSRSCILVYKNANIGIQLLPLLIPASLTAAKTFAKISLLVCLLQARFTKSERRNILRTVAGQEASHISIPTARYSLISYTEEMESCTLKNQYIKTGNLRQCFNLNTCMYS